MYFSRHFRIQTYINIDNTLFIYTSDILRGFIIWMLNPDYNNFDFSFKI